MGGTGAVSEAWQGPPRGPWRGHGRWGSPKRSASEAFLLDLKEFTGGLLAHGMGHAPGVMLFESTTPDEDFPEIRSGVIIEESMRSKPQRGLAIQPRATPWVRCAKKCRAL